MLPPELEEIYEPRHLEQEEDEDDETETARALSEREKRELFRQHRNLGHPQPTELVRYVTPQEQGEKLYGLFSKGYAVQHAKHDLYLCHRVQECHHAAYVLTSALALIWLTWKSEVEPPPKH